jgi:putative FmdB family regulatory protein
VLSATGLPFGHLLLKLLPVREDIVRSCRVCWAERGLNRSMPTYEFTCNACSEQFSQIMSFTERADTTLTCPKCGSEEIEQRFTAISVKTDKKTW